MPKPCELRIEKKQEDGRQEVVCGAGGFALRVAGEGDSRVKEICGVCPIPDELRSDGWACLYLRPIRIRQAECIRSYFSCRWFYQIKPTEQPESIKTFCHGCVYWFPRPRREKIRGYWVETERIRATVEHPPPRSNRFADWGLPPSARPRRPSWWRLALTRILG